MHDCSSWQQLELIWKATDEQVLNGVPHDVLAPGWQVLLLGDGSPTKHLTLLSGQKIEVDIIEMKNIGDADDSAPPVVRLIPMPRLRRQVWLRTIGGERLAYATSWWPAQEVDSFLTQHSLPIWTNLARSKTELYRDIQGLYCGNNRFLAEHFEQTGPFWGRHYLFWHNGKPLTAIYEVFSPALTRYLSQPLKPPPTTMNHNNGCT